MTFKNSFSTLTAQNNAVTPTTTVFIKRSSLVSTRIALVVLGVIAVTSGRLSYAQAPKPSKAVESLESFKNKPTIIRGKSIGGIELGMTEAQVKEILKLTPDSVTEVEAPAGAAPSPLNTIRRDRYVFKKTEGFNVLYEGTNYNLFKYAQNHAMNKPNAGDSKELFFTDVLFKAGKVVQIETDMPTYFTPSKANLQTPDLMLADAGNLYESYGQKKDEGTKYYFTGSRENGLSLCVEALGMSDQVSDLKSAPVSRMKIIVHPINTFPVTGAGLEAIGAGW